MPTLPGPVYPPGMQPARLVLLAASLLLLACGDDDTPDPDPDAGPMADLGRDFGVDAAVPFAVSTSAFDEGGPVPEPHRCGPPLVADESGMNVSPALAWTAGPADTASYAVVVRDMSAGGLVHWAIYDIPAVLRALPEGVPAAQMPLAVDGARQAEIQGSGYFGYFGPCSGGRGNVYVWTLHALPDETLPGVDPTTPETEVAALVEERSLASASLSGTY